MVAAPPGGVECADKHQASVQVEAERTTIAGQPETPSPERCGAFANGPQLTLRPFVDSSSLGCGGIVFQLTGHGTRAHPLPSTTELGKRDGVGVGHRVVGADESMKL